MNTVRLYGHHESGNCLKALWTAQYLGLDFEWVEVDIFAGASRTDEFLALNPAGQVPVLERADGRTLAQSNAHPHLSGRGLRSHPSDPFDRAKMNGMAVLGAVFPRAQYRRAPQPAEIPTHGAPMISTPQLLAKGRRALA